jgi:hypothetical protein
MPQRLPTVLSSTDLPLPELHAARLDGELFRVDDAFAPVDEIERPLHRAQALRATLPDRLIAEQRSAAWVWGALDAPPAQHELCVLAGTRTRAAGVSWMHVREVVLDPGDLALVGGMQVTTALRTAVDLARFSTAFGEAEGLIVRWLMRHHGFDVDDCRAELDRRRNLPNKRQAITRLSESIAPLLG